MVWKCWEKKWIFLYAFEREIGISAENQSGLIILNMTSRQIRVNENNLRKSPILSTLKEDTTSVELREVILINEHVSQ